MGINSTEVAYGFGQFGSTLLKGDNKKLLMTASTAKYYACAITMLEDTTFEALEVLDGGVNLGMGNTYFVATDGPFELDKHWNGNHDEDTTVEGNENHLAVDIYTVFPKGITMYGMWDNVELNSGSCIVYIAPRHDYRNRAAIIDASS